MQRIGIPSYFYPGPLWTQMENAVPTVGIVIINPDSGPGNNTNADYANQVASSQTKGQIVLGYVATWWADPASYQQHTGKPITFTQLLQQVKADIQKYFDWYNINGLFLDQASTKQNDVSAFYQPLHDFIKSLNQKALTVLNPGTQTDESYMSVSDIIVTFEGTYNTYKKSYTNSNWISNYASSRFWHLIHATGSIKEMRHAVFLSKQRNAGWVYVTPDSVDNPWDSLPPNSYWNIFLALVPRRCV